MKDYTEGRKVKGILREGGGGGVEDKTWCRDSEYNIIGSAHAHLL